MVYFVEIWFKDRVVNIHKWFLLHLWKSYWMIFPQICEITAANDSTMGEKCGNMDKKFPQSWKIFSDSVWTSGSFLMSATQTTKLTVATYDPPPKTFKMALSIIKYIFSFSILCLVSLIRFSIWLFQVSKFLENKNLKYLCQI